MSLACNGDAMARSSVSRVMAAGLPSDEGSIPRSRGSMLAASTSSFSPCGVSDEALHLAPGPMPAVSTEGKTGLCLEDSAGLVPVPGRVARVAVDSMVLLSAVFTLAESTGGQVGIGEILVVLIRKL